MVHFKKIVGFLKDFTSLLKSAPKMMGLVYRASPFYFFVSFALVLPESLLPPAQIWISKLIIDSVVSQIEDLRKGGEADLSSLFWLIGIQLAFWVLNEVIDAIGQPIRTLQGEVVGHKIEMMLEEKAATIDYAYYDIPRYYDKLTKARDYVSRPLYSVHVLMWFLKRGVSLVIIIGMLSRLSFVAVGVVLITIVPHAVSKFYFGRQNWKLRVGDIPEVRLMSYICGLLTHPVDGKEIRIFGLKDYLLMRFDSLWKQFFYARKRLFLLRNATSAASGIIASLGAAFVYGYAIRQAIYGKITLGDLALYLQIVGQVQAYLIEAFLQATQLYAAGLDHHVFQEFMDLPMVSSVTAKHRKSPLIKEGALPFSLQSGVELQNVSFRYPESDQYVLKNLSLKIPAGKKIAFVGENGSGKTTTVKLIARLYEPSEGRILLDGHDIRGYDKTDFWKQLSAIFQDFSRYQLTVKENIGFGMVSEIENQKRLMAATEKGGGERIIDRLPAGYDTYLGKSFTGGVELSGGEWQKIALSRAFMADSPLLILDEPTASLDARSEYEIYKRINELTADKTVIFISHRFSTIRMADIIFVFKNGEIVESGSHEKLMKQNGLYAEMFRMQAEPYQ